MKLLFNKAINNKFSFRFIFNFRSVRYKQVRCYEISNILLRIKLTLLYSLIVVLFFNILQHVKTYADSSYPKIDYATMLNLLKNDDPIDGFTISSDDLVNIINLNVYDIKITNCIVDGFFNLNQLDGYLFNDDLISKLGIEEHKEYFIERKCSPITWSNYCDSRDAKPFNEDDPDYLFEKSFERERCRVKLVKVEISITNTRFNSSLHGNNILFLNSVDFSNSTFSSDFNINKSSFFGPVKFFDSVFESEAKFSYTDFFYPGLGTTFLSTIFMDDADFYASSLAGIDFCLTEFKKHANFVKSNFQIPVSGISFFSGSSFDRVKFADTVSFDCATFETRTVITGCKFSKDVSFKNLLSIGEVYINENSFNGKVVFNNSTWNNSISFRENIFSKNIECMNCEFNNKRIKRLKVI